MGVIGLKRYTDEGLISEELRAERLFPAKAADENRKIFLLDDNTLGFVYECQPLPGGDEKTKEKLEQLLGQNYPDDTIMQFFLYRSPDIERQLQNMERMRAGFSHPLLTPVLHDRVSFLRLHTDTPIVTKNRQEAIFDLGRIIDLKLIISVKIPFKGEMPSEEDEPQTVAKAVVVFEVRGLGAEAPMTICA